MIWYNVFQKNWRKKNNNNIWWMNGIWGQEAAMCNHICNTHVFDKMLHLLERNKVKKQPTINQQMITDYQIKCYLLRFIYFFFHFVAALPQSIHGLLQFVARLVCFSFFFFFCSFSQLSLSRRNKLFSCLVDWKKCCATLLSYYLEVLVNWLM